MFSEVIKGLLEYRSARVVQQSNSFIGISGVFMIQSLLENVVIGDLNFKFLFSYLLFSIVHM